MKSSTQLTFEQILTNKPTSSSKISLPNLIAGVDEVGRGPLAGAVIACAVILDPEQPIVGLMDSKKLTEKKREYLAEKIKNSCLAWAIGRAEVV